ncbi:hypothetical protein FOA52_007896 [Chlamydomonas sp. UWO 241]|nr:hypothetical protein FOA52_007896 [Chlamydomonas sp. UWO 241]
MRAGHARRALVCAAASGSGKGVVITGGSKGLGFAMAREFLAAGDGVVLCGREGGRLAAAVEALRGEFPSATLGAQTCDVSVPDQVDALADYATGMLGTVHVWINNAGSVTSKRLLADVPGDEIVAAVGANVLGSLLGSRAAVRVMRAQAPNTQPLYHVFNLGFTSWGASLSKTAVTHKSTKRSLSQLTASLREELAAAKLSSIGVHNLSPGLVLTDLLLKDASPVARRFFNTLADEPEVVAAALVPKIRSVQGSGTSVEYLTPVTALSRVLTGLPQIINGGRFFDKDGNRVAQQGAQYKGNGVRVPYDFPAERY